MKVQCKVTNDNASIFAKMNKNLLLKELRLNIFRLQDEGDTKTNSIQKVNCRTQGDDGILCG